VVDLFVEQEQDSLFSFEHVLDNRVDLSNHRHEEDMVSLVHEALVIFDLFVKLLLDIVFHLMRDEPAGDLVSDMAQQSEVVGREILVVLLVGDLEDADRVISQFDRDQKNVTNNLVQLLVHGHVVTELVPD